MNNTNNLNEKLINAKSATETANLLAAGADVNARDFWDKTALMYASTPEQTKVLIDAGADVNAKNFCGITALMLAKTPEQKKLLSNAMQSVRTETKVILEQKPKNTLIKLITTKNLQKSH